jgi:hypothetical protein
MLDFLLAWRMREAPRGKSRTHRIVSGAPGFVPRLWLTNSVIGDLARLIYRWMAISAVETADNFGFWPAMV